MLAVLLVGVVSVAGLQGIANAMSAPATPRAATTAATPPASVSLPQGVVAANANVFHLPQANPALMTPAVDQQGRVWVGEMGANKLASSTLLVPTRRSGVFSQTHPPCMFIETITTGKVAASRSSIASS